jgi:tRNA pseudouridine38-40 synthase
MKRSSDSLNHKTEHEHEKEAKEEIVATTAQENKSSSETTSTPAVNEERDSKRARTNDTQANQPKGKRLPKRKVALIVGYRGTGYQGIQRNPKAKSIEVDIEHALVKAGAIAEFNAGSFLKVNWQRCARTDKGVHAITNVISLNMIVDVPNLLENVNLALPPQIRLFAWRRVTKGFDSKNNADSRIYEYLLPSFVLDSARTPDPTLSTTPSEISSSIPPSKSSSTFESALTLDTLPTFASTSTSASRFSLEEVVNRVNQYLAMYEGTHNFWNFTARVHEKDPSAKRYIISFKCSGPVMVGGMEFIRFQVQGQSFMLHQIRKMIGLLILLVRRGLPKEVLSAAYHKKMYVPVAPAEGLMLQQCIYDRYNEGKGRMYEPISWAGIEDQVERFKMQEIYPYVAQAETEEKIFSSWVKDLEKVTFNYNAVLQPEGEQASPPDQALVEPEELGEVVDE